MALDTSIYERARRGIRNQYVTDTAQNQYARTVAQQRGSRDINDYRRDFTRSWQPTASGYGQRGAAGPGTSSGIYNQAMSDYMGDYTRGLGRMQNDQRSSLWQYDLNADQLRAQRNKAYTDLEFQKAQQIAGTGSWLKQLRAIYGGL